MKKYMKNKYSVGRLMTLVTFLLISSAVQADEGESEFFGARFKEGKGIELSAPTRVSLGLETAEAEEGNEGSIVPVSAILEAAEGKFVYVANGNYFIRTPILTGKYQGSRVEIIDGLFSGDVVVTKPVDLLWYTELQAIRGGVACADGH